MAAPAAPDEILDVNRRYHDVAAHDYDAKWGISFGEIGRHQVLGKVTKLLGERPGPFARSLEIGSGTGYFSLNLMQDGVIGAATCTDISPGMLETLERNAATLGLRGRDRGVRRRRAAVRGRELRPRARPRRAAPPARPRPRVRRVLARAGARAGRCSSPASRRATATGSPPCPSARRCALAPAWRRALRARPAPAGERRRGGPRAGRDGRRPRVRARRPRAPRRRAGFERRPRAGRGAAGELVRLVQPHARGDRRRPRTSRGAGSSTPTAATSRCRRSTAARSSRGSRRTSSTT